MAIIQRKRLVHLMLVLAIMAIVLGDAQSASAQAGCFVKLRDCFWGAAANARDWYDMWLRGFDCELFAIDCTRRLLIGR
jgi:hypothetical protein